MNQIKIAVIGLGYVGLPLARLFATKYPVVGFDINKQRVSELMSGTDNTLEVNSETLKQALKQAPDNNIGLYCSSDTGAISDCNVYIVTVPTPIDRNNSPDLTPLIKASEMIGRVIRRGDIVIYESTTYPGCTEEDCIPVIERVSGLKYNLDFYAGYSPERINPGDKLHTVEKIKKVTSGSTPEIADRIDAMYQSVIVAGTHKAPSIKVAEASKIIENSQRDVNISFMNELALIFDKMGIDTNDVLDAAASKWNFLKFKPGLVGGHCISVDPYYLANKAETLGYIPQVILSGRRVNNSIPHFIAHKVLKLMIEKERKIKGANVLIMGVTFKENCPDIRNTKVIEIYRELSDFGINIDIYDPWVNNAELSHEYGISAIKSIDEHKKYEAIIVAVAHDKFKTFDFEKYYKQNCVIFDTKAFVDRRFVDGRL
jgi:UDP-N-acetyl-D-galactosamine dehydrogenase